MRNLTLLTDLYQLTMMNGYYRENKHDTEAVFDLFFRENGLTFGAFVIQYSEYLKI